MKRTSILLSLIFIFASCTMASAQVLKGRTRPWTWQISNDGYIEQIVFKDVSGNDTIPFFRGNKTKGPAFYINDGTKDITAPWTLGYMKTYKAVIGKVVCSLKYEHWKAMPSLIITLKNTDTAPFKPTKAGIKLGIDTYMDKYPE